MESGKADEDHRWPRMVWDGCRHTWVYNRGSTAVPALPSIQLNYASWESGTPLFVLASLVIHEDKMHDRYRSFVNETVLIVNWRSSIVNSNSQQLDAYNRPIQTQFSHSSFRQNRRERLRL